MRSLLGLLALAFPKSKGHGRRNVPQGDAIPGFDDQLSESGRRLGNWGQGII